MKSAGAQRAALGGRAACQRCWAFISLKEGGEGEIWVLLLALRCCAQMTWAQIHEASHMRCQFYGRCGVGAGMLLLSLSFSNSNGRQCLCSALPFYMPQDYRTAIGITRKEGTCTVPDNKSRQASDKPGCELRESRECLPYRPRLLPRLAFPPSRSAAINLVVGLPAFQLTKATSRKTHSVAPNPATCSLDLEDQRAGVWRSRGNRWIDRSM